MVDNKNSKESNGTPNIPSSEDSEIPIGDDYKLYSTKKLGSGAFGEIYQGNSLKLNEDVAIKLESSKNKNPQLLYESKLYTSLQGGGKLFKYNI